MASRDDIDMWFGHPAFEEGERPEREREPGDGLEEQGFYEDWAPEHPEFGGYRVDDPKALMLARWEFLDDLRGQR